MTGSRRGQHPLETRHTPKVRRGQGSTGAIQSRACRSSGTPCGVTLEASSLTHLARRMGLTAVVSPHGGHSPGAGQGSTGVWEEKTRISLCIYFFKFTRQEVLLKVKYRRTSDPCCTCRQTSHIRLVRKLCWGNRRGTWDMAGGRGFALSVARRPLLSL